MTTKVNDASDASPVPLLDHYTRARSPAQDWLDAGFFPIVGTRDGLFIEIGARRYRLVTWTGAKHYRNPTDDQCWMHADDFARNEWVEVMA